MMSDQAVRRLNFADRVEALQEQAERWQRDAWDRGDVDEAAVWFELAGILYVAVMRAAPSS